MRYAYAVEGATWGPRVRARAVVSRIPGGTVVGQGEPLPPDEGVPYRRVSWTDPEALLGYDVVVGDPSVVMIRPPDVPGVAVRVGGQPWIPRVGSVRPRAPELVWDAERYPLHPWSTIPLPSRGEARARLEPDGPPLLVVLDQSHSQGVLHRIVSAHAPDGWQIVPLIGWGADVLMAGADLLVVSGGWAQTVQARATGVPYIAVDQGGADQWVRSHCTVGELATVAANLRPARAEHLRDNGRAVVPDFLPRFARYAGIGDDLLVRSGAWITNR